MIVVVPCGGEKANIRCRASEMYVGRYHKACRLYANSLVPESQQLILSALYGFVYLDEVLDPYDLVMGQEGCVSVNYAREQIEEMGLLEEEVVALGGDIYIRVCRAVWPDCETPLRGVGGIGKQLAYLEKLTQGF